MPPGVRVQYSRIKVRFLGSMSILFAFGGLIILFQSEGFLDILLGCFIALFFGAAGYSWLQLLDDPRPALEIDEEGVGGTAFAPPVEHIPWSDILGWEVGDVGFQSYVVVTVADVGKLARDMSRIDRAILRAHNPGVIFLLQLVGGLAQLGSRPDPIDVAGAVETVTEDVETGSLSISPVGLGLSADEIADLMEQWCS